MNVQSHAGSTWGQGIPNVAGMSSELWDDFQKAVVAGYGTDSAALTGGGALRIESLEHTLMSVIQTVKHFRLFNKLKKNGATATVDEWTEQDSIGGRLGGSFNTELGDIRSATGNYARKVAMVKYLMTRRSVSVVQNVMNTIIAAKAQEEVNGTLQLLTDAEWAMFYGDSSVVPEQFDGLGTIIRGLGMDDHIIDLEGQPMDGGAGFENMLGAAATIYGLGSFGEATDIFLSVAAQTDLDLKLDPAFRVPLTDVSGGGTQLGAPVAGIRTSFGNIANQPDVFLREGWLPPEAESPAGHVSTDPTKPASVTVAAAAEAASKFAAAHAGAYYWGVTSVNANGESAMTISAQEAVAAGEKATVTITRPATQDATGFRIYRSRRNGTNAPADMRFMFAVPYSGAATTVFVDLNREIPGTSQAFVLNMNPSFEAIGWRQMLPMTRFALYPTAKAEDPWAQFLFGYLRVTKRKQHLMIKNILPNQARRLWNPF